MAVVSILRIVPCIGPELEYQARNYSQWFIGEWRNSYSDLSLGKRRREEK
jgi:hypothetical protein